MHLVPKFQVWEIHIFSKFLDERILFYVQIQVIEVGTIGIEYIDMFCVLFGSQNDKKRATTTIFGKKISLTSKSSYDSSIMASL